MRGTPRDPMSRAELIEKARDLKAPVQGRQVSERLMETVYAIEKLPLIRNWRPLLQCG